MLESRKFYFTVRWVVGAMIAIHGLIRIVGIGTYIDFILSNYKGVLPFETVLIVGGALFPFLEFFTGLLLVFNIQTKKALVLGFFISLVMSAFIVVGGMYERLLYHSVVLIGLTFLYFGNSRNFSEKKHFI